MNRPEEILAPSVQTDSDKLARVIEGPQIRSWALTGLLVLSVLTALFMARDVVVPLVLALVLSLVFAPIVRALNKLHIPNSLGAALVVVGLLAAIGSAVYNLGQPAAEWLDKAPQGIHAISAKLSKFTQPVQTVTRATEQVERMSKVIIGSTANSNTAREVMLKTPTFASAFFAAMERFAVATVATLVLFYYFLASGDLFLRKVIAVTPRLADKARATEISKQVEDEVSAYLFAVTLINIALGSAVGLALYALGVPNPALWGVMVAVFNFIPYLGDFASFIVLAAVGLLSFDALGAALLVPGVFVVLTAIEGYVITPLLLAKRLSLSPVVIVISVLFWGWMWGICGALLAVPILVALKTFCARIPSLQAFGEFLGA